MGKQRGGNARPSCSSIAEAAVVVNKSIVHTVNNRLIMFLNILSLHFEGRSDEPRIGRPHFRHQFHNFGDFQFLHAAALERVLLDLRQDEFLQKWIGAEFLKSPAHAICIIQ